MGAWTLPSGHPSQVAKGSDKPVKTKRGKTSPQVVDNNDSDLEPGAGGGGESVSTPGDVATAPTTDTSTGANTDGS